MPMVGCSPIWRLLAMLDREAILVGDLPVCMRPLNKGRAQRMSKKVGHATVAIDSAVAVGVLQTCLETRFTVDISAKFKAIFPPKFALVFPDNICLQNDG